MKRGLALLALSTIACAASVVPTPTLFVLPTLAPTITESAPSTATLIRNTRPTSTFVPTASEVPAPTSTSTPNAPPVEVVEYLEESRRLINQVRGGMSGMGIALGALDDNPSLYFDDRWAAEMVVYGAMVLNAHDLLLALVPPPDMAEVHSAILIGTDDCVTGTEYVLEFADTLDATVADLAGVYITQCDEELDTAASMIEVYQQQFDN